MLSSSEPSQPLSSQSQSSTSDEPGPPPLKKRATQEFFTSKLAAAFDRCKISDRDAVHILYAVIEALGQQPDVLIINRSSIHRIRERLRQERTEQIREKFSLSEVKAVTVHWDGKLLPALTGKHLIDRLPIIVTGKDIEQLLGIPELSAGTGVDQASAVHQALEDWGLTDKVQALCCDTTASNTGRLRGACVLLEQLLERDLLYSSCRHHIFEIILKSVFDEKIGPTSGPVILLFKRFQQQWSKIDTKNFSPGMHDARVNGKLNDKAGEILSFAMERLGEHHDQEDYRVLLE